VLDIGGRLGLSLGLADALTETLGLRDKVCRRNNDLDLDRSTVNKETVQFVEGLAGAIGVVEGNVGNTPADTSWAV
jgi:hypothetical protein